MATSAAAPRQLSQKEQDIQMMLAAEVHLGTKNCDFQMERYVFKRRNDGIYIINLGKTWEKLQLAARIIVAIENPQDIIVQSARPYGQRAVLKFAQYTGANAIAGRHTPGTFTNQMQTSYNEPRLLILTDPRTDHQVDLFFYREPEEAKQQEEEEAPAAPEYAIQDFAIQDFGAAGIAAAGDWEPVPAPQPSVPAPGAVAPTGWE
ncbi:hypothetical protein Ahy_A02g009213 isoform G [Arachis hypogaea]|uniref:40S ribosomal protein SA n=1 Tax=Arachis hypogaea TaxID=3818 RepID=A0A445EGK3_ARAHY|nr:hypothetical protein Ahy_A02g009213 isoform G [Arachis hypogaea]